MNMPGSCTANSCTNSQEAAIDEAIDDLVRHGINAGASQDTRTIFGVNTRSTSLR